MRRHDETEVDEEQSVDVGDVSVAQDESGKLFMGHRLTESQRNLPRANCVAETEKVKARS